MDYEFAPIESYPCNSKKELEIRERYHIDLLKSKLNTYIPSRTNEEYRENNRELIKQRTNQWVFNNPEEKKEIDRVYRENNKEKLQSYLKIKIECDVCGVEINKCNLIRHKLTKKCIKYLEK